MRVALLLIMLTGCIEPAPPPANPPTIVALALRPPKPVVVVNRRIQLIAQATGDNGQSFDQNAIVEWASADPALATVNELGQVKGLAAGRVEMHATHPDGVEASVFVDVLAADVNTLAVAPASTRLTSGASQQLTATAQLATGANEDCSARAAWASNNIGAVTVDATGLAACVAPGQATVAATFLGVRGVASVVCE
jgi:uncharacterized protein YjdB